ncbi:MAG TPA: ABC transporter permease [Candidatus Dormibacteraeota bacterium]|jgi:ABC-2 type transport system permease protein|nr:ABC transporter permease [Candidatus Dormibacteraeota bacterium]
MNRPSALTIFLKTIPARAHPRFVGVYRNPAWIVTETLLPLIGTIAMVYVYRALHAPTRYLGFVVLGGVLLAFWQNVIWAMATQFFWDRAQGNLELFVMAPTSLAAILLGMAVGGAYMSLTRAATVLLVVSLVFGVSYSLAGLLPALAVFLLTIAALYCLGMLLASLFLFYQREAWHLADALQEPIYFLSGFYFPVRSLGAVVAGLGSLIPMTLGLDAIRQLLLPGTPQLIPLAWEVLAVALQIPIFGYLSQLSLRILERRARQDARLILRTT